MSTPENQNYLSPIGFRLIFNNFSHVSFFAKSVTLPTVTLPDIAHAGMIGRVFEPGDKLDFGTLDIRFGVDEDMMNWKEAFNWMIKLGRPESFDDYTPSHLQGQRKRDDVYSDARLQILTGHRLVNNVIVFKEAFPTALTPLTFDATLGNVEYLEATMTVRYRNYEVE